MLQKVLRPVMVASALAVSMVSVLAPAALADKSDFWVRNDSENTISELYLSASNRDSWDNDLLGSTVLESGDRFQVTFGDYSDSACLYDIRAVFSDGQVVEDYQVNVCNNDYYTFFSQ
ncbi:hypothetical protein IFO70_02350 [Phormidium tenue FACHB-886]|nr:hypothetical protein [Phormidium tenue FACHB-886]